MSEEPKFDPRLRAAVDSVEVPPFLESRIRNRIAQQKPARRWLTGIVSAAAAASVLGGVFVAYQLGHLRLTVGAQESYISSLSGHVATLMRVGLGDHVHCAVFRKYPENPPAVDDFIRMMKPPQYAGLIPIVRSQVPDTYRMTMAHECGYHGRRFVHLSLKNDKNMLSLVITRKASGESFSAQGALPALVQSGIPMYQTGIQRFQLGAFETRDFLVYVISDMEQKQNTELMLALSVPVKDFLAKLET